MKRYKQMASTHLSPAQRQTMQVVIYSIACTFLFVPHTTAQNGATGEDIPTFYTQSGIGANESGDSFGKAVATGDFNMDGALDVAVGVPDEAVGSDESGAVMVFYSSDSKPGLEPRELLTQETGAGLGKNEDGDGFGSSLAVPKFSSFGGGLVVGAPGENPFGRGENSGAVYVYEATEDGLKPLQTITQKSFAADEEGDHFGWSLAYGYDAADRGVLAVGAIGEARGSEPASGAVFLFRAASDGFEHHETISQETGTGLGKNEEGDWFGASVAFGQFNDQAGQDLAIGAPQENKRSGRVFVFHGTQEGNFRTGSILSQQGLGKDENGDLFGRSLAAGHLISGGSEDLAVGAPREDMQGENHTGAVFVFKGTEQGLEPAQLVTQKGLDVPERADVFGWSLAVDDFDDDDRDPGLAVGAVNNEAPANNSTSGGVFIYDVTDDGLEPYALIDPSKLHPQGRTEGGKFGWAVARGYYLVVGAPETNVDGVDAGAMYVVPYSEIHQQHELARESDTRPLAQYVEITQGIQNQVYRLPNKEEVKSVSSSVPILSEKDIVVRYYLFSDQPTQFNVGPKLLVDIPTIPGRQNVQFELSPNTGQSSISVPETTDGVPGQVEVFGKCVRIRAVHSTM